MLMISKWRNDMAIIKPSSELRNHYNEISQICHETNEPVYITKNGQGDVVMLSMEAYKEMLRDELWGLLEPAIKEAEAGLGRPADEVFEELRKELGIEEI